MKEELNKWAKTLINTHKNPIKKLELSGTKLFLPSCSEDERALVNNSIESLAKVLQGERVEKRCTRSIANWLPEQKLAEIKKNCGISSNFGFANKQGHFLHPEETMFLLETNRLELIWNNIPLSIKQAFEIILTNSCCSLSRYLSYRKLTLQGFRLIHVKSTEKHKNVEEPLCKKPRFSEDKQGSVKTNPSNSEITIHPSTNIVNSETTNKVESYDLAKAILNKIKESGPKKVEMETKQISDYKIFLPENSKRLYSDFDLNISQSKCVDPHMGYLPDKTIVTYTTSESSGYFQFGRVNLPDL